jgi:hypothetical protein
MGHVLDETGVLIDESRGQMTVLKGILMRTEACAQACLAEMREWRSQPDTDEPTRDR